MFNTFFALFSQGDQVRCFQRGARVLEPEGAFLLECFVPDIGRFDQGQSLRTISVGRQNAHTITVIRYWPRAR